MILAEGKALAILSHLVGGCSVSSTKRLTGVYRDTILDLLNVAGRKREALNTTLEHCPFVKTTGVCDDDLRRSRRD